ncbi:unnamed protein product [Bursaphelenchus okinawaensis]|uniref:Uncharacterized protein n=1 Tax=Bursaphelenchus okinawaensis TaxID=465554 RepID=A0A811KAH3_9BILA|nr:unnamed protein product [Bursaphelenchus okinawaensis]CAG9096258.1 unnamed protein product [Bursaphelenchus okinawaensis]
MRLSFVSTVLIVVVAAVQGAPLEPIVNSLQQAVQPAVDDAPVPPALSQGANAIENTVSGAADLAFQPFNSLLPGGSPISVADSVFEPIGFAPFGTAASAVPQYLGEGVNFVASNALDPASDAFQQIPGNPIEMLNSAVPTLPAAAQDPLNGVDNPLTGIFSDFAGAANPLGSL